MAFIRARDHPDVVRRIARAGHAIGGHGWDHRRLPGLDRATFATEVDATARPLTSLAGTLVTLMRPPGGFLDATAVARLRARGQTPVLWDVDPLDWQRPGIDAIVQRVLGAVRPGSIVLLHSAGGDRSQTVAALPRIVAGLRARNFELVTLAPAGDAGPMVGRLHGFGGATPADLALPAAAPFVGLARSAGAGHWVATTSGAVLATGSAPPLGADAPALLAAPIVGMAATPSGAGYWLLASDGGVFTFADAVFHGAANPSAPHDAIGIVADGHGSVVLTADRR